MTPQEFIRDVLPTFEGKHVYDDNDRRNFEQGLDLVQNLNDRARKFADDARRRRDYPRRVQYLRRYLVLACEALDRANGVATRRNPRAAAPRRVGRPTLQEQAEYQEQTKAARQEEEKQSLFADEFQREAEERAKTAAALLSVGIKQPADPNEAQPLTHNGIVANPNGSSIAETMLRLTDLAVFLTETTQKDVHRVRDLRTRMADAATKAKDYADANARAGRQIYSELEIAGYASTAQDIQNELADIYHAVDTEMAEVYVRLKYDPRTIARFTGEGGTKPEDLRTRFKPYYTKVVESTPGFKQTILDKIHEEDPELGKQRAEEAARKEEAADIIKYLTRKDKPNSARRIATMTQRLARLHELIGDEEAKAYDAVLKAAQTDYETNIKPTEKTKKTAKKAEKSE